MACRYIYKGHEFNSEVELDDFLIENRRFESILGDTVFSATSAQNNVNAALTVIANDAVELQKKYKEWLRQNKMIYTEDGDESFEQPPYIGVNKFLSGLTNEEGELLFPEFREDEYWSRRYSNWKIGEYTDAEIEEFGIDPNNRPRITDSAQHQRMRDQMEHKWEIQAKTGTAIHNVLQLIFSKENDNYNFMLTDLELKELIQNKLEPKNRQFLNDNTINETIRYARSLHRDLVNKFGDNLTFYPEFTISQDTNMITNGSPLKLFGIIDLLIVDSQGRTHILDYKTSIHDYKEFSGAKKNAYSYQMAVYQRMLQKCGINTYEGQLMVAPIQIQNFRKSGDTYIYDGIQAPDSFLSINTSLNSDKMWSNIDEFMPAPFKLSLSAEKVGETVATLMAKWFPNYSSTRLVTEQEIINRLKAEKRLTPDENGVYSRPKWGFKEAPITATSEAEFVQKVLEYERSQPARRLRYTAQVKNALQEGIKNGISNVEFPAPIISTSEGSVTWLKDTLAKYCDGNWEVVNNEVAESYGLIVVKTKDIPGIANQVDFIRVSTNNLTNNYRSFLDKGNTLKNRKGLTGTYEPDVIAQSKANSLMAEAVNGNVELMETMLIINQLTGLRGHVVGNIQIVNPLYANGMQMSNEQLLYCFNELNKHDSVEINRVMSGEIQFANKYELVRQMFTHIMQAGEANDWKDDYKNFKLFKSSKSVLDQAVNGSTDEQIRALQKLLKFMMGEESKMRPSLEKTYRTQTDLQQKHVALYNAILVAIAQLKGVNFRQQLRDHDKWLESIFIMKNGVSGSYLDNPGNLSSETLNLVTKLVTEAYQNTRDEIQRKKVKVQKLVENLKRSKGFGSVQEHTVGNQVSLYENLYEETADGDLLFKNVNRISDPAERELLEYALQEINRNRFPDKTQEELDLMKANGSVEYYRVPLALGGSDSVASTSGLLSMLRAKLSYLNPKTAFERAQKKVEGVFNAAYESEEDQQEKSQLLYQMTNMFDEGQKTSRLDKIKLEGIQNFERNLETLLLKHMFAYSVKENIDTVFPMIKAAMVHITSEGAMRNREFTDDIQYLEDYIKNKILNQSIVDPKNQKWVNMANMVKSAASKMTLAFAPVQMFYQPLQGLWQDISLMIRKPDGKDSFTFQNFIRATKLVYGDFFHYSDKPTVCKLLNEVYGINDMDMNTYIDRISTAKRGFWNFENWMFKFASRPDFYNRMTIFTSQMMGDGCLDAHSINSDGQLIYDWKKDKRFKAFANGRTSDPQYSSQKALYYAVARQFVNEHARNADGSMFELNMSKPMALPRAYTNKQAESMKSLGDDIYGYYSHEKKSLVMSTALGSLWLQFKTYWSGKKNQYLAAGGVKLRGDWKHYEENGQKYYYQVDSDGNILYDKPPTTTETIAPVYQWEGQWQEGIILTLSDMAKEMWNQKSFIKGFQSKWDAQDSKLRNAYRSNMKQALYDTIMFMLVGSILGALLQDWLDDLKNENRKNRDFATGLGISAANIAVMSVKNSFLDLNFINSVGAPVTTWTPFAFEWSFRMLKNWTNVAMGDEDFWDGVVKSAGGLKQFKPALDAIKPDMFRTEREGGTFNKKD